MGRPWPMNIGNWSIEYIQWWSFQNLGIISLEGYEVQPLKLKIVYSRYLENMISINYPLSHYEKCK